MATFCKDCVHILGNHTCNRPVDLGANVVTGVDEKRVIGWDAAYERAGGTAQVFGQEVPLCGPDAQFFSAKPADWKEPEPEPAPDTPLGVQRQIDAAKNG